MPRLYREAPLASIWEGSGNVMSLDVLRALTRSPRSLEVFLDEVRAGQRRRRPPGRARGRPQAAVQPTRPRSRAAPAASSKRWPCACRARCSCATPRRPSPTPSAPRAWPATAASSTARCPPAATSRRSSSALCPTSIAERYSFDFLSSFGAMRIRSIGCAAARGTSPRTVRDAGKPQPCRGLPLTVCDRARTSSSPASSASASVSASAGSSFCSSSSIIVTPILPQPMLGGSRTTAYLVAVAAVLSVLRLADPARARPRARRAAQRPAGRRHRPVGPRRDHAHRGVQRPRRRVPRGRGRPARHARRDRGVRARRRADHRLEDVLRTGRRRRRPTRDACARVADVAGDDQRARAPVQPRAGLPARRRAHRARRDLVAYRRSQPRHARDRPGRAGLRPRARRARSVVAGHRRRHGRLLVHPARLLPLPGRRRGGRAGRARHAYPEHHRRRHHGSRAGDDPCRARRCSTRTSSSSCATAGRGSPWSTPLATSSASWRPRGSTPRSPPGARRCRSSTCSRGHAGADRREAPLESLLGSEGLGRLGAMVAVDATACCRASSRWPRCAERSKSRPERESAPETVRAPERYRVLPAATPFPHVSRPQRAHASTRRLDHRGRPRRPARRARRRSEGRERGDHEQGPPRSLALGRRRRRDQRGDQRRRRLALARLRHGQGLGLPRRPGRDRSDVLGGARRGDAPRAHRRHLPPQREGRDGPARVRRRLDEAHRLRRRHHRPGAPARALRAADEAPRDGRALRGVVHDLAPAGRAGTLLRRDRARRAQRAHGGLHGEERDPRLRRRRPGLQADDQRADRDRRRHRAWPTARARR